MFVPKNNINGATIIQDPNYLDSRRVFMESQDSKRPESVGRIHKSDHQEQCEFEYQYNKIPTNNNQKLLDKLYSPTKMASKRSSLAFETGPRVIGYEVGGNY